MITPDVLTKLLSMAEVHKELEESVLRDIARRIAKSDFTVTETAAYEIEMGQQAGLLFDEITEAVSKETAKSKQEVKALFKEARAEVLNYDEGVLEAAGIEPVKFKALSPQMKSIYTAALAGTTREIVNLTRTTAALSETSFINVCNVAHAKVASGIFTYQEAIREAIEQAAQYGTRVLYPSGATASLDVAVRRAVLSGVGKTASTITEMKANEFEVDLMELSAHAGARPEHAVWQGRIVSRSGRPGYLALSDIGYGLVTGFRGANCSHDWFMFFEGYSERAYTDEELEAMQNATVTYNGEEMPEYRAREKQRASERKIRSLKRELIGLDEGIKASDDPEVIFELKQAFEKKAVKLKSREAELADFCNQTGLKRDRFREQMFCAETEKGIKAWTKSVSSKAVWSNKKALDRNIERDIIKEIKSAGIKGNIILGTDGIDISSYSFDSNHINKERNHKVNNEEAIEFAREAKFIAERWEGRFRNYYGEHGAVYVDVEKENIRTAFKVEEFDDKIKAAMGVLKRYGR